MATPHGCMERLDMLVLEKKDRRAQFAKKLAAAIIEATIELKNGPRYSSPTQKKPMGRR
jgi:hypothetical protein